MGARYQFSMFGFKLEYEPKEYINIKEYNKRHNHWKIVKHLDLKCKKSKGSKGKSKRGK